MERSALRGFRIGRIFEEMTLKDSAEMLDYIMLNFQGRKQRNLLNRYYNRMGELDGVNTFESVLGSKNKYRLEQLSAVAKGWAKNDPTGAWAALMEVSSQGAIWKINTWGPVSEIAKNDPALAVRLIQDVKDHDSVVRYMGSILSEVSLTGNYDAVFQETLNVENPMLRNQMLKRIFEVWGENDFEASSQVLASLTGSEQTDKAMRGMLTGWARVDGKGAFEYVLENRDDPLIGDSLVQVAAEWARNSTASELEDFVTNLPEGHDWDDLASQVSYNLARVNPKLAMDMSMGIKDEQKQSQSASSAMWAWTRSDIEGAEQYFESMEEIRGKTWARYSLALANIELQSDPQAAIQYVDTVPDAKERTDMLNWLSARLSENRNGVFRKEDLDSFVQLLADNPNFSDEEKNTAIARFKK